MYFDIVGSAELIQFCIGRVAAMAEGHRSLRQDSFRHLYPRHSNARWHPVRLLENHRLPIYLVEDAPAMSHRLFSFSNNVCKSQETEILR